MTRETIPLAEFEANLMALGTGIYTRFLLALEPLTATRFVTAKPTRSVQVQLSSQWHGRGGLSAVKQRKGGSIRTRIIDDQIYVVWYPAAGENGASSANG